MTKYINDEFKCTRHSVVMLIIRVSNYCGRVLDSLDVHDTGEHMIFFLGGEGGHKPNQHSHCKQTMVIQTT